MAPTAKLLTVISVVLVAAWLAFSWGSEQAPGQLEPIDVDGRATVATAQGAGLEPNAREHVAVVEDASAAVDLSHPFAFRLRCRVNDLNGLPVADAQIAFGPIGSALNAWQQVTSREGVVEVQWRARVASMTIAIGVSADGRAQALRQLEVAAGPPQDCVLLADATVGRCGLDGVSGAVRCTMCHMSAVFPNLYDVSLQPWDGRHPESRLCDMLVGSAPARPEIEDAPPPDDEAEVMVFEAEVSSSAEAGSQPEVGSIIGLVYGDDGRPAPDQVVIWGRLPDQPMGATFTASDGRFRLVDVLSGTVEVRAGGRRAGLGRTTVQVFSDREASCRVQLDRGQVLRGIALDADGKALKGWRVEFGSDDGSYIDAADVQRDGSFELPNQPDLPGTLLLWSAAGHRLPMAIEPHALARGAEVAFDFRERRAAAGQLRLQPVLSSGVEGHRPQAFVWQVDSGRGAAMPAHADGGLEVEGLRAGFYHVVVGAPGSGWSDLGQHWVDGSNSVDLGAVELPTAQPLQLLHRPSGGFDLYLRRAELDLRAPFLPAGDRLLLPAGRWLALWGSPEALQMAEFSVAGDQTVLDFGSAPR